MYKTPGPRKLIMKMSWMKKALTNEKGAFDLPSIMVGVVVVGIVGAVTVAAVVAYLPWLWHKDAINITTSVQTAQTSAYQDGLPYQDYETLTSEGYMKPIDKPFCIITDGDSYQSFTKYGYGKIMSYDSTTDKINDDYTGANCLPA